MRVITGIIGSDPLVLVCFWPNRDPRESPCKVFYVPNDYRLLATGKTSAGTFVKTAMYMVILILLYDTVCYLQIHNAIGVVGRRLILVVKSLDETALYVKDFQAPCPHWPGQEDGGLALTFNVQFHVFDLAWQAVAPFPEFQEIPVFGHREGTEEEACDWSLA